ncbi:copper uptake system-associated protein [Pseudomonas sp. MYb185]|uniref:copper uptake system-associated protein n=1 Tax=Pseudomonas sp. MYb185 TaxID=1848729 RepID=UPI000CFD2218|nr:copper uptake system-associated protein [Pseudomonas sp. MYb185]PRB81551.1 hypothetical protein CQ007_10420 [Pseudomonas sp. MYb185]
MKIIPAQWGKRMLMMNIVRVMALGVALLSAGAWAGESEDSQAIKHLMKHTWERPNAPLQVKPVTVEEDYAIAGWTQDERGGRALLQRTDGAWRVLICAGDGLLEEALLLDVGLDAGQTERLLTRTREAERGLSDAHLARLALFGRPVRVDSEHSHSAH